jgi:hypothetical protein
MPDTTKLDGREGSPLRTVDADVGVRKEAEPLAEPPAAEALMEAKADTAVENADGLDNKAAGILEEESLALGSDEEASIREFAASVMTGLEEAGIDLGALAEPEPAAEPEFPADPALPDLEPSFFAGWDGLLDEQRPSAAEEPIAEEQEQTLPERPLDDLAHSFEDFLGGARSLSEIGSAAALAASRLDAGETQALSSKHDELADAVQSALSSIYGEPAPAKSPSPFTAGPQERTGWDGPDVIASADASLTPQDVILNYFSYDTNGNHKEAAAPVNGAALHEGGAGEDYFERASFFSEPEWTSAPARQASYDGPPSYPAPALAQPKRRARATSERESSRLLGAAAIGLVGGIAIAASLAVFVINSYGPGGRTSPNASSRAPELAEQGYGRASETQKGADGAPLAEQALTVAVADSVATPGQASPLSIAVKPEASGEQALVSITGVPDGARLNAGVDAGGGNWLLPPHRLKGLSINVPTTASEPFLLGVQLLDSNVRTPLSDRKQFAIRVAAAKPDAASLFAIPRAASPESAPREQQRPAPTKAAASPAFSTQTIAAPAVAAPRPEPETQAADANFMTQTVPVPAAQQPAASRLTSLAAPAFQARGAPQTEIEDLIREGNKRMREGDILEARQLYQKAVAFGDPEAALAMGRSYDPIYFSRIDRKNAEPDAARAFDWYRKAMDAGAAQTAKVRIENLKHFLNE